MQYSLQLYHIILTKKLGILAIVAEIYCYCFLPVDVPVDLAHQSELQHRSPIALADESYLRYGYETTIYLVEFSHN